VRRDAFGRPALWLGENVEIVWMGWRKWVPFGAFYWIPQSNPMADVWRWQAFVGPVEIRGWVPRGATP
jgi:hypothetical protein